MVAEWSRAPAIASRKQGDVGLSPCPAKIPFSDENFLNNSIVYWPLLAKAFWTVISVV